MNRFMPVDEEKFKMEELEKQDLGKFLLLQMEEKKRRREEEKRRKKLEDDLFE